MLVKECMEDKFLKVSQMTYLEEALGMMDESEHDTIWVVDGGDHLLGRFSLEDLLKLKDRKSIDNVKVQDIYQKGVHAVRFEDEIKIETDIKFVDSIPVINDKNKLIGVVTKETQYGIWLKDIYCESSGFISSVLDSIYNGIVVIDNTGKIVFYSKGAERIIGIKSEMALGKPISSIIPTTKLLTVLKTGKQEIGEKMLRGDTTIIYNGTPIYENKRIVGAVAVFHDLLELESITWELTHFKELTREYDAIFDSSYDGFLISDGDGKILKANKAFERHTGLSLERIIGQKINDLVDKGILNTSSIIEVLKTRSVCSRTVSIKGERSILETSVPVFSPSGRITRVVTNIRDMTELNKLRSKLNEKDVLTQGYFYELEQLRSKKFHKVGIVYKSNQMQKIMELISKIATYNSTVLISGESGVGKELVARTIHEMSPRRKGPFIEVNCGAIPETLIESELFGYEKGSFTGASREGKLGFFELAQNGTIFLDEITDLPLSSQPKLLKVLQSGVITRIGGLNQIKVNTRVIAATNRDLHSLMESGEFRVDLYYRIKVIPVYIPPLRERREDIPVLISYFVRYFNEAYNLNKSLDRNLIDLFCNYNWPGNVRQLENIIERLLVTSDDELITIDNLPEDIGTKLTGVASETLEGLPEQGSISEAIESLEKALIEKALKEHGSTYKAAKFLKIDQSTVYRKAKKYKLI